MNTIPGATDIPGPLARSVWAKTGRRATEWLQLPQHMLDSAAMAERLFDHWLASGVRQRWGAAFPGGVADARLVFVFLAAAHDVGKASPVFVAQVETMAARCRSVGLQCQDMAELKDDRRHLPHATVSEQSLVLWLKGKGAPPALARQLASVVGAHHGRPVGAAEAKEARGRDWATGGASWAEVRVELLDWLDSRLGISERFAAWQSADVRVPLPVLVGMSGLVVMADWVASNVDFLPLRPADDDLAPDLVTDETRWNEGWDQVAMPPAWEPAVPDLDADSFYRTRFGWGSGWAPRQLQQAALELVRQEQVGLLIIESAMGSGKTEAAFVAAEVLAGQWGAQGLFVALPTQATTDAMFERMLPWLQTLPHRPADAPAWAMTLAHGKAALNRTYAKEVQDLRDYEQTYAHLAGMDGIHDEEDPNALVNAVAHQWFTGRKRRMLANFGIGTIDQVLMAGLQQRHLMLRHLALAGKVVIIDEVHASDDFMNVYLESVLGWLGHYGIPVILLSATLTEEHKRSLLRAYAPDAELPGFAPSYPVLTWVDAQRQNVRTVAVNDAEKPRTVVWDWMPADEQGLVAFLRESLRDGGCALVIRNTVRDAQRTAELLTDADIASVTLAHARFLAVDRAARDDDLRTRFGPSSGIGSRPERAIVVATQVVEQSLDVDFDLLITDLAPMDLMLQRIGRLHRHAWRERPTPLKEARVFCLIDKSDPIPIGSPGSHFIYGDHLLFRTAVTLQGHGPEIRLPDDIAPLVQQALGLNDPPESTPEVATLLADAAQEHHERTEAQRAAAATMCLSPWLPEGNRNATLGSWMRMTNDPSEVRLGAMVRDTLPTLEVIVVPMTPDGATAIVPAWLPDPGVLDTSSLPDDDTARRLATWSVKLPPGLTRFSAQLDAVITELENGAAKGWAWHRHRLLKGELFMPMNQLNEGSRILETTLYAGRAEPVRLRYSPERGLEEVTDEFQSGG